MSRTRFATIVVAVVGLVVRDLYLQVMKYRIPNYFLP